MKGYTVFNVEQIEGLPAHYYATVEPTGDPLKLIESAEAFFAATGATFRYGGDSAYYAPVPTTSSFRGPQRSRMRKASRPPKATIAELGAAFLCADLGITPEPRADHAGYLAHWLTILKADQRAIFTAAAQAQRAVDFLHGLQPKADAPREAEQLAA
jgi:antirestriction protein ArdC